jgi:hypothetical protein
MGYTRRCLLRGHAGAYGLCTLVLIAEARWCLWAMHVGAYCGPKIWDELGHAGVHGLIHAGAYSRSENLGRWAFRCLAHVAVVPTRDGVIRVAIVYCDYGTVNDTGDELGEGCASFEGAEDVRDLLICWQVNEAVFVFFDHVAYVEEARMHVHVSAASDGIGREVDACLIIDENGHGRSDDSAQTYCEVFDELAYRSAEVNGH